MFNLISSWLACIPLSAEQRRMALVLLVLTVLVLVIVAVPGTTVSACYGQATGEACCPAC